jgi:pectate lyase
MIQITRRNRKLKNGCFGRVSLFCSVLFFLLLFSPVLHANPIKAFPGAQGWAAYTPGGRGGKILRVTNLKANGPGSFAAAVQAKGRRIVVFEVGGVIDLQKKSISITEPYLTIAGQTAPSPGITFIRGGISIRAHDVVVRHISVRPGEAGAAKKSGWEVDGIATGSYNIIVDHCSCTWATDENLSASGPRFDGKDVTQWRKNTSHRITFSNCIIAEGLSHSTHAKGEHSKGSLIHDNATEIAIIGNLYASNVRRNPYFKGGVRGVVVNNVIANPGRAAMHYGLPAGEWTGHDYVTGQMVIVANVMEHGPDTPPDLPLFVLSGAGPVEVYERDNITVDRSGRDVRVIGTNNPKCQRVKAPSLWPEVIEVIPTGDVKESVLTNAGARPWDRNAIDRRIIREARVGSGKIIDSEQKVGGYPVLKETRSRFNPDEWDLVTMERKEIR